MPRVTLATNIQKCVTCDRWDGVRQHSADGAQVEFDAADATGKCIGGPWDGSIRDPLSRCGRWVVWLVQGA